MKIFRKKDKKEEIYTPRKVKAKMRMKLNILFEVLMAALLVLLLVFGYIAIFHKEEYAQEVLDRLNYSSTTLLAERGTIYDCNMSIVAKCDETFILIIDPGVISYSDKNKEETIACFSEYFGCSEAHIRSLIEADESSNYLRYWLEGDENKKKVVLSYDEKVAWENYVSETNAANAQYNKEVEAQKDLTSEEKKELKKGSITGIWFESEYARFYPYYSSASKVIGFTSNDSSTGIWGLESYYNDELSGVNGRRYGYVNGDNSLEQESVLAQDGNSIVSTIDMNITAIVERAIERWHTELGLDGKSWAVLVMNPNNGEIKTMTTSTDYDLNNPRDISAFYSEQQIQELAQEAEIDIETQTALLQNEIWRNFIISDTFEPGSTAKTLTISAALEEDAIAEESHFFCDGARQVANYLIKCHNYALGGCGDLDLAGALAQSCNVALINIGENLGAEEFARYQEIFNLGQKTGIDLPGEASAQGLLYEASELGPTELATSTFGQSYNVTMIQLAAAYASIINGGNYYKPHTVSKILDANGYVLQEFTPEVVRETVSKETSEIVKRCLEAVIEEGTAAEEKIEGYRIGGKTGTAEKLPRGDGKYIVSFISAAPIDDPQMLVYAVVDEPTEYSDSSYPALMIVRYIWEELLPYLGISKDESLITSTSQGTLGSEDWSEAGSFMEEISDEDDDPQENDVQENNGEQGQPVEGTQQPMQGVEQSLDGAGLPIE